MSPESLRELKFTKKVGMWIAFDDCIWMKSLYGLNEWFTTDWMDTCTSHRMTSGCSASLCMRSWPMEPSFYPKFPTTSLNLWLLKVDYLNLVVRGGSLPWIECISFHSFIHSPRWHRWCDWTFSLSWILSSRIEADHSELYARWSNQTSFCSGHCCMVGPSCWMMSSEFVIVLCIATSNNKHKTN